MIIFDFDGVLLDSIDELAVVSYMSSTGIATLKLDEIPTTFLEHFRINRFHGQPVCDFITLARWCLKRPDHETTHILTRTEWELLKSKERVSEIERRDLFFANRSELIARDAERWQSLMKPFQPLWQVVQRMPAHHYLILTNKNRQAVTEICAYHQLKVADNRIYSGDLGITKSQQLLTIRDEHPDNFYLFVDDSIHNLLEIKHSLGESTDLDLALAMWGYIGSNDKALATRSHIALYEQWDLIEIIEQEIK